jgi:hypothetical protein
MLAIEEEVNPWHPNQRMGSVFIPKAKSQTEFERTNHEAGMRGARWRTQVHQENKEGTNGFI